VSSRRVKICKARNGDTQGGWWVIDSLYGIHLLKWTRIEKEAIAWCEKKNYDYSRGWEY